jgi:hypothetical protein
MYVCIYKCTQIITNEYINYTYRTIIHIYTHMNTYKYIYIYIHTYIYVYVCIYVFIGRSPAVLTMEFESLLKMSKALFGRKFDPFSTESMKLVDEIDTWRPQSVRIICNIMYMYVCVYI